MLKRIGAEEGGEFKAVASGTLPSGKSVVVNADGTVSVVSGSDTSAGTPVVFGGQNGGGAVTFDSSNNKVVAAYQDQDNSNYGTAVVGTVSGSSISFGTPVVFGSANIDYIAVTFDSSNNKAVIAYRDGGNSSRGTGIVGTVSGTSISFGSSTVFNSGGSSAHIASTFDTNSNKVVIAYMDYPNSLYGTAVVGTVSGTSISFGSETVFESAQTEEISAAFDSNSNKIVISYQDNANSSRGTAIVGTVSGASISFGSAVVFESGAGVQECATVFDSSSNKIVIAYRDGATTGAPGTAIVGTVSGTSISFGTKVEFNQGYEADFISGTFDSNANKVIIAYRDRNTAEFGTAVAGTVSGTSISFDTPIVYEQANSVYNSATFDSNANKVVIAYRDSGNSGNGTGVVFSVGSTNLTSENYIGMSKGGAVADTKGATVDIIGAVNDEQSGLTAGQQYYVQTDGTIGTTAATPSVLAGTAISATELLVKT
jgi:hypothetical protein